MSWRDALINPFDFTNAAPGLTASQHAERLPQGDQAGSGAAARETCDDCGRYAPCNEDCPNFVEPHNFELDSDAFMAEIEPAPLFLQDCEDAIRELLRSSGEVA